MPAPNRVEVRTVVPAEVLDQARRRVGPDASTGEVVRRALAVAAGLDPDKVPTVRRGRPPRQADNVRVPA